MAFTAAQRATVVPASPPSEPRIRWTRVRTSHELLDGAWWPRSTDPVAELAGLIIALDDRFEPIQQIMLNNTAWDRWFRRIAVGNRVVKVSWFATLNPALVIATTEQGAQLDLLVVPSSTPEAVAEVVMAQATDPDNTMAAADILRAQGAQLGSG